MTIEQKVVQAQVQVCEKEPTQSIIESPLKPYNEWREKREKMSTKPAKSIKDIPIYLLKKIISHTHAITDTNHISSLRQVCRSWNITINKMIHEEITRLFTKNSLELTLCMKCQTHIGETINLDLPLRQGGLNNRCEVEFFPQINHKLEKQLFADHYKFIDFFLFLLYNDKVKEISRNDKRILRFSMKSGKFVDNSDNLMIDLDLAFQYIPYEPITFRVKVISFSPIYLLDWFNAKKDN